MKEKQKKILQIIIKAQERNITIKNERDRLRDEIASFRKKIMIHEEKICELKEAFVKKQNKNAFFEVDLTRSQQELREFLSSFTITDKRSAKFLDSAVFIESDDSTFED